MSECRDIEVRERLPEYLHGRLSASARAIVDAHLSACAECREELELLRSVRAAYALEPAVNVGAIVKALPRPRQRRVSRNSTLLRIAAAISFVSLGGVSLVVARSAFRNGDIVATDSAVSVKGRDSAALPAATSGAVSLSVGGGVADLGDADLKALIKSLDLLEGAPPAEPESGELVRSEQERR